MKDALTLRRLFFCVVTQLRLNNFYFKKALKAQKSYQSINYLWLKGNFLVSVKKMC
jgi:hypothetical protein